MNTDIRLILANNLDLLMREKRWTQVDVAKISQQHGYIDHRTISTYLKTKGKLTDPKLTKIEILAACFDLSPSELLDPNLGKHDLGNMTDDTLNGHISNAIELLCEAGHIKESETDIAYDISKKLPHAIKVNIENAIEGKQPIKKTLTTRLLEYFNRIR